MAERRMLTKKITSADAFVGLSSAAQALYMHLNLEADDDGFNNQVQTAMARAHASTDDLRILLLKGFIYCFDDGVIVIKHWRIHNLLRKDRYKPTNYVEKLAQLGIKENGAYTVLGEAPEGEKIPDADSGCHLVATRLPQVSKGKDSIVLSKESARVPAHAHTREKADAAGNEAEQALGGRSPFTFKIPTVAEVREYCEEAGLELDAERFVDFYTSKGWTVGRSKMKDWRAAARNWARSDKKNAAANNAPPSLQSFDVEDFFDAAMKKSYGANDKGGGTV